MSAPFAIGDEVRLTGPGWDSSYPRERGLATGMVVTVTAPSDDVTAKTAMRFVAGLDREPWYVDWDGGEWAGELVHPKPTPRPREEILSMIELTREDRAAELAKGSPLTWSAGWEGGWLAALEWVLDNTPQEG